MTWLTQNCPAPFDQPAADRLLQEFKAVALNAGLTSWSELDNPSGAEALLNALFGNSPFLSECAFRHPAFTLELLAEGPTPAADKLFDELDNTLPAVEQKDELMRGLRQAKAKIALLIAAADISQTWSLEQVTGALSRFAETALELALSHLLRERMLSGEIAFPEGVSPDGPVLATPALSKHCGFFILGMGKLGARELNYSSDIDLIVLYDADVVRYKGRKHIQDCFIRITQNLVRIMQDRTEDGYVFRTDLRLRPDPGATAVALSAEAAEFYYQSIGLNWERAAMIKARPVAGDLKTGLDFLSRINGFVWRKNLDYAALEDIHAIKNHIHRHHRHGDIGVVGHDVKLGRGGIREIEFFAQIHQLIAGGRERELRVRDTVTALKILAMLGRISQQAAHELTQSYYFLRRLEHRLQMVRDEQTHEMPNDPKDIDHIACFMGYNDTKTFERDMIGHLVGVHKYYDELLSDAKGGKADEATDHATGNSAPNDATVEELASFGFSEPARALEIIDSWSLGRYRASRTPRARAILKTITPKLIRALKGTADPDAALVKFDEFLKNLPSGVQLFSLLQAHPWLLEMLGEIMGMAPALADILSHRSQLLDAVLSADFFAPLPPATSLRAKLESELDAARDFQDVMDISRRWVNEHKFQIGVQLLRGLVDGAGFEYTNTNLADATLQALFIAVQKDFEARHGSIAGGSMVVVGMGKLGGRELTFTSDLDLIFIYEHDTDAAPSDGRKSLAPSQYFARLGQSYITALTAMTGEGRLYEVDMRLRPSGTAGPIAVSFQAFQQYQRDQAWTWEHLALVRARVCAGPERFAQTVTREIMIVLSAPREPLKLLADTADMRERLRKEFGTENPWSIKHTRGGLVDIEFICQYLLLKNAHKAPEILSTNTHQALLNMGKHGILTPDHETTLSDAFTLMNNIQALLRLCVGERFVESDAPRGLKAALVAIAKARSFEDMKDRLQRAQAQVTNLYRHYIEIPATAAVKGTDHVEPR